MTPQELKSSILQLAVQGRLVPQAKTDIQVDLSGYKVKKTEEIEFVLPDKWVTGHLECVTDSIPSKQYQILESQVLSEGKYAVISQSKEYSIGYSNDEAKLFHHSRPVVIFGDHTTEVKLVDFDFVVGADGIKIFAPKDCLVPKFFYYAMLYLCTNLNKIGGYSRHYKYIKNKPIPIPPLAEQKRIVEKIEECLPLIDRYEQAWLRLEEFNKRFPKDMYKSILQLAIRGRLVPQEDVEGSGDELLNKIQDVKDVLIRDGIIKRDNPLAEISEDEIPFEIPESWTWCRLAQLVYLTSGKQYVEKDEGIPYLKVADMNLPQNQYEVTTSSRFVDKDNDGLITSYSIIFPKRGGAIATNKKKVVKSQPVFIDSNSMGMTVICPETFEYIKKWFDSIDLGKLQSGTSVPQINNKDLYPLLVPLPPLAEQKRIVEKLAEILPLCERLN